MVITSSISSGCLADALDVASVGVRRAGGVHERALVKAGSLDHQRVAVVMADRMAVLVREDDHFLLARQRLVHRDLADLVVELVQDRDLGPRPLDDLERVGRGEHARQPVWHAVDAGPSMIEPSLSPAMFFA